MSNTDLLTSSDDTAIRSVKHTPIQTTHLRYIKNTNIVYV